MDLESQLRELEKGLQEERRKRVAMKKDFRQAMEAMIGEMIDNITDEKTKNIWEAIKQLQIERVSQQVIGEITDRDAKSVMKKRTRLEVEEF